MEKYKVFSIVMSSMLILGTASPTMVAVAESVEDKVVEVTYGDGELIKDLFNDLDTVAFDSTTLSDIQITALEGFIAGTYQIVIEVDDNTTYISFDEIDEKITDQFDKQEVVTFVSIEDEEKVAHISLSELFELTDLIEDEIPVTAEETLTEESVQVEELTVEEAADVKVDEPLAQVEEATTADEKEIVASKADEEVSASPVEVETEKAEAVPEEKTDVIPEAEYTPEDYSENDDVSLSRDSETEALLNGDTYEANAFYSMMMMYTSSATRVADSNGVYTVQSGDTFNAIATSFKLSTRQLIEWNGHVSNINSLVVGTRLAVTRRGVETLLSDADKERLYRGGAEAVFTLPQEFIDAIATRAIEISNQEGQEALWPSLMIAQAAHESNYGRSSLASPPYHNLSGIKGSHNGMSVLMWTWEVLDGVRVDVLAPFRHYPSYDASLQSYAGLLRNGLSWSRQYYSGTWRSNTNSVWDVLNNGGLRGYATDPKYYEAIKRIIDQFDLTKYDTGNYYVRTGTFLGEAFTQQQVSRLVNGNLTLTYSMQVDNNKEPYAYRRIETTEEYLGTVGAQRVIDQLRDEKGWGASMVDTGTGTEKHRVRSGFFNTLDRAELALERFKNLSGYSASIEHGSDGKYRILTGFFNGATSAQRGLDYMNELGWGASIIGTGNFTPHYIVRTGTFNTPNHVNSAEVYFNSNGWGSDQVLTSRNNPYYRIYAEGFAFEAQAKSFVDHLSQQYNWGSTAFPVYK